MLEAADLVLNPVQPQGFWQRKALSHGLPRVMQLAPKAHMAQHLDQLHAIAISILEPLSLPWQAFEVNHDTGTVQRVAYGGC